MKSVVRLLVVVLCICAAFMTACTKQIPEESSQTPTYYYGGSSPEPSSAHMRAHFEKNAIAQYEGATSSPYEGEYPPPPLKKEGTDTHFETQIIGMSTFIREIPASLRIVTFDERGLKPVNNAEVTINILDKGPVPAPSRGFITPLFKGKTDRKGTLGACIVLTKPKVTDRYLQIIARSEGGTNTVSVPIKVKEPTKKIYLTTDKPLYQPNQKIHIRALAFLTEKMSPAANDSTVIEVEDPKGNKVFKKKVKTSNFGVASTVFELADDINMGDYKVKATIGDIIAEKNITVKKYVLPKFKSEVALDRSFYQPGMKLKGKLSSRYFFGKPVTAAKVTIRMQTFDAAFNTFATVEGKTDKEGVFSFEQLLPTFFAGQPLEQGKAFVQMEIEVVDTADHKESMVKRASVVRYPFQILVMPESKKLIPSLANKIYLLTSYPDGSPAKCQMQVAFSEEKHDVSTDETGFAEVSFTPKQSQNVRIQVSAKDAKGDAASTELTMSTAATAENIIVRLPRNTYRVGEMLDVSVFSTQKRGMVYIDLIRQDQTVLTKCIDLEFGRGRLTFNLTPETAGQITLHAYKFLSSGDLVRDTKSLVVSPARDLTVKVGLDAGTYKPGEPSKISFEVRNKNGKPQQAALGIEIVDESLFALAEKQPGLEKIYFMLQQELLTPKYEICNHSVPSLLLDENRKEEKQTRNLTKILFTQAITEPTYQVNVNTYDDKIQKVMQGLQSNYYYIYNYYQTQKKFPGDTNDIARVNTYLKPYSLDPWGKPYKVILMSKKEAQEKFPAYQSYYYYYNNKVKEERVPNLVCLGADGILGTEDDVDFFAIAQSGRYYGYYGLCKDKASMATSVTGGPVPPSSGMRMALQNSEAKKEDRAMGPQDGTQANLSPGAPPARVREYFPETLYVNPQLITDEKGRARIEVPMADSITTWRMSTFAHSLLGEMGNITTGIRVFQDFFVDIDLPVALTQNDEVSLPIAVYNYLPSEQTVRIKIVTDQEPWFELLSPPEQRLTLKKDEVTACYFRLRAKKVGLHKLTFYAYGSKMSDAIRKEISVMPDGKEFITSVGDRLRTDVTHEIMIPDNSIPDASRILVTMYPGIFSQVVEGLDSMLRMPFG